MRVEGIIWFRAVIDKLASNIALKRLRSRNYLLASQSSGLWKKESKKEKIFTWLSARPTRADTWQFSSFIRKQRTP